MAGKYTVIRLGPNRAMGLAVRADPSRLWDGACYRSYPHHWPAAIWVLQDDSLYAAEPAISRRLGCARAAARQRLFDVDDETDSICRRRRLRAEGLIDHCRFVADVVALSDNQTRG